MLRKFGVWVAVVMVAWLLPAIASAQSAERKAAREGLTAYNAGDFETALKKFKIAEKGIESLQLQEQVLVRRYLAYCLVAFGKRDEAKAHFVKAMEVDPGFAVDAARVSPKIFEVWEQAVKEMVVDAGLPVPSPTPAVAVATPKPTPVSGKPTPVPTAIAKVTGVPTPAPTPGGQPTPAPSTRGRGPATLAAGAHVGTVLGFAGSAPGATLNVRYRPLKSGILSRLAIGADLGFYSMKSTVEAADETNGVYDREYALTVLPIEGLVELEQPFGALSLYGTVGGGMSMVNGSYSSSNPYGPVGPSTSVSAMRPGFQAGGGVRLALGPGQLGLHLGTRRAGLGPEGSDPSQVFVPLGGLSVALGYLYSF